MSYVFKRLAETTSTKAYPSSYEERCAIEAMLNCIHLACARFNPIVEDYIDPWLALLTRWDKQSMQSATHMSESAHADLAVTVLQIIALSKKPEVHTKALPVIAKYLSKGSPSVLMAVEQVIVVVAEHNPAVLLKDDTLLRKFSEGSEECRRIIEALGRQGEEEEEEG
eukprot:comp12866_c0_seq2/m.8044 comp12866_c0_seq2/g.8044  ORF comp12866_c0_seq2/g.8044 comp12866_c0_seq2/m.8044 type:complete len:168 (-) comp12866_c0_seq2:340-843(-)